MFQGPQQYISPSLYPTKHEHGKVVPTWNYITVHAWGRPQVIDDAAWLSQQVEDLTVHNEASRPAPWQVSDAPEPFVAAQLKGIVGIEIPVARIEGKWKVSQNRPAVDQAGVVAGLRGDGDDAEIMASLVAERSKARPRPLAFGRPLRKNARACTLPGRTAMAYDLNNSLPIADTTLARDPGPAGREQVRTDLERLLANPEFISAYCGDDQSARPEGPL